MSRRTKRFKIWFTRHVPVPLLLIGVAAVVILCLNDEVSPSRNYSYLQEIVELKSQIRQNLEHIAREQYQMQKPDEEVYLIR